MLKRNCIAIVLFLFLMGQRQPVFAQEPAAEEQKQEQPKAEEGTKTPPPVDPAQITKPSETASTPSTGRRIVTNFWSDEKAFFTSPFHMKDGDAKRWGIFGLGTAALIATDRRTSHALPNTTSQIAFS